MDNKNNENSMFQLVDSVSESESIEILEGVNILDDIEETGINEVPVTAMSNIKGRTMQKLQLEQTTSITTSIPFIEAKKRKPIWKPMIVAAACILVLLLTTLNFKTVVAEVKKLLVFIPGINRVIDKNDETVYVLPKPVKVKFGQGEITVTGVSVDSKTATVSIWGKDTARATKVLFLDSEGNEYEASAFSCWGGSGWQGSYTYRGSVRVGDAAELRVIIKDLNDLVIPLSLEIAKGYESYNEMGSTDFKNNMSLTAVTEIEQERLKINLLTQIEQGITLVSYGSYGKELKLTDTSGKEYELWRPDTGFLSRDIYYFDTKGMNDKSYILTVPYLEIERHDENSRNTTEIGIPKEGELIINKEVELAGFPVIIKSVERLDDKSIRIYTDVKYDKETDRSLKQFSIGNFSTKVLGAKMLAEQFKKNGSASGLNSERVELSHSMKFNEVTEVAEFFEIGIEPDAESIILLMYRPLIEVRGPWNFEINP